MQLSNITAWKLPLLMEAKTLNTEILMRDDISTELLHRDVEMRHKIDIEANAIYSITSMLALFETCGDDTIELDPVALGKINQMLNKNIVNIWEIMDDFIYIVQARSILEKSKNNS